jgi:5-methyltetrahydropteroyltriglutamate--homocysteine methyltransferase
MQVRRVNGPGFSSTEEGNKLTIDDQLAKLELIVEAAQEVWG